MLMLISLVLFVFLVIVYDKLTIRIDKLELEIHNLQAKQTVHEVYKNEYNESVDPDFFDEDDPEIRDYLVRKVKEERNNG